MAVSAFDFREFYMLAEELGSRPDEAARRSAISRAYYAMLATAWKALPASEQARIARRQVHQLLWARYATSSDRACRQVGGAGARLRDLRRMADYRDDVAIPAHSVRSALDQARDSLRLIDRYGYRP